MLHRANYKKGYLEVVLNIGDTQMTLQDIDYGGGAQDRNIPAVADITMRLVIWGVQYPNPGNDPNREIVTAVWSGAGTVFNITRAQEGSEESTHYIGDNVALLFTADMSREVLIFDDMLTAEDGSIGYLEDTDGDGDMEVQPLEPDGEVSDPEGYSKILVTGGPGAAPYWQFAFATEVGAIRA